MTTFDVFEVQRNGDLRLIRTVESHAGHAAILTALLELGRDEGTFEAIDRAAGARLEIRA